MVYSLVAQLRKQRSAVSQTKSSEFDFSDHDVCVCVTRRQGDHRLQFNGSDTMSSVGFTVTIQ